MHTLFSPSSSVSIPSSGTAPHWVQERLEEFQLTIFHLTQHITAAFFRKLRAQFPALIAGAALRSLSYSIATPLATPHWLQTGAFQTPANTQRRPHTHVTHVSNRPAASGDHAGVHWLPNYHCLPCTPFVSRICCVDQSRQTSNMCAWQVNAGQQQVCKLSYKESQCTQR